MTHFLADSRFDHVGLSVPDLEAGQEWYRRALGLEPATPFAVAGTDLRGVMLRHPSGYRIELLHRPAARPRPAAGDPIEAAGTLGYGHLCLSVPDVASAYERLLAEGATTRMAPSPAPRAGATVAFVADPYGNLIELIDHRPAP